MVGTGGRGGREFFFCVRKFPSGPECYSSTGTKSPRPLNFPRPMQNGPEIFCGEKVPSGCWLRQRMRTCQRRKPRQWSGTEYCETRSVPGRNPLLRHWSSACSTSSGEKPASRRALRKRRSVRASSLLKSRAFSSEERTFSRSTKRRRICLGSSWPGRIIGVTVTHSEQSLK